MTKQYRQLHISHSQVKTCVLVLSWLVLPVKAWWLFAMAMVLALMSTAGAWAIPNHYQPATDLSALTDISPGSLTPASANIPKLCQNRPQNPQNGSGYLYDFAVNRQEVVKAQNIQVKDNGEIVLSPTEQSIQSAQTPRRNKPANNNPETAAVWPDNSIMHRLERP